MASALEELGTASPDAEVIASWVSAVRFVERQSVGALTRARVSVSRDKGTYGLDAVFDPIQGTAVQSAFWLEYHRLCDELGAGHGLTQDRIMAQALHDLIVRGASVTPEELNNRPVVLVQVLTDGQT